MTRKLAMVKKIQCPGCVCGSDPETCSGYRLADEYGFACSSHVLGTAMSGVGPLALGLPKGFCRPGYEQGPAGAPTKDRSRNQLAIRMWTDGVHPKWNNLNVPVWAMEHEGFLFVRTYSPRMNLAFVDVIDGGKREELCPGAIDVATFLDTID